MFEFKKEKIKDIHEFHPLIVEIQERPINPLGRAILWLVVGVLVFGILWLFAGKIDIVVSARGQVIPFEEVKILQPIETGVVSKIFVKEGDFVSKGDVLMQIDPSVTQTNLETKQKDLNILNLQIKRLKALLDNLSFTVEEDFPQALEQQKLFAVQKRFFDENIQRFDTKLSQARYQYETSLTDKQRLENIVKKDKTRLSNLSQVLDIIAKKEYEELEKNIIDLEDKVNISSYKVEESKQRVLELEKEKEGFVSDFKNSKYTELVAIQKEYREIENQINAINFQNQKQSIVSPVDSYVAKLMVNTIGGVVTPAEKLISIVPKDAQLIVKATVLNQDIGFVKNGMDSKIKIDTFSFQKYGFFEGEVINVGNFSIEDEKLGDIYEVKIKPNGKTITVEGKERYLEPGMSVTAEIKVGKRRIIEFFIYPMIQYLDEGMSVR